MVAWNEDKYHQYVYYNCFGTQFNKFALNFSSSCTTETWSQVLRTKKAWDPKWLLGLIIIMNVTDMIS